MVTTRTSPTLYDVLGTTPSVGAAELKAAFKRRALALHPDKGGTKEAFHQVMLAFETLADPARRARYDGRALRQRSQLAGRQPASEAPPEPEVPQRPRRGAAAPSKRQRRGSAAFRARQRAAPKATKECEAAWSAPEEDIWLSKVLSRLFFKLRRLPEDRRRAILTECFSQAQRLELERWVSSRREQARGLGLSERAQSSSSSSLASSDAEDDCQTHVVAWSGLKSDDRDAGCAGDNGETSEGSEGDEFAALEDAKDDPSVGGESWGDAGGVLLAADTAMQPHLADVRHDAWASKPGRGSSGQRGLLKFQLGGHTYYQAVRAIDMMVLCSPRARDLAAVIDYHLVLTDVACKLKAKDSIGSPTFESSFKSILSGSLEEHGMTLDAFRLTMYCQLSKQFWIGKHVLYTPRYRCVDTALRVVRCLSPFKTQNGIQGKLYLGLDESKINEFQRNWEEFKEAYLHVCSEGCLDTARIAQRLQRLEDENLPHRERERDRALERWSCRAMRREDRHSQRWRNAYRGDRRGCSAACRERGVRELLERWRRREDRRRRRAMRRTFSQEERKEKRRAAEVRREELRRRKERRRAMAWRKDITMGEILGCKGARH